MKISQGWLDQAQKCPSPNHNLRPDSSEIGLLVIHNISLPAGHFGGPHIEQLFTNCLDVSAHPSFEEIAGLEVSAHLLIRRDGTLIQFVPFHLRAWHAGVSCWEGREACNDFSIGIELEGTDTTPFEQAQYQALAGVTEALFQAYPNLTPDTITGHSDIAPGRKTDPGEAFDWEYYRSLL
ncbi:1,6-anhydro-N-acetylmuramyl-L-alanine amidase AmpD [Parendozoicomonas haliclonae]|uniref:1,6-anhydro-N-acetylmuramyl-L-alanine amidase AmpD n=1 Tax=Parendozoicomonas haliclonae TaxID=1960125 RepID=A0A1X7AP12_9GAMM|nr:1,6-anhydro-N-acetylmuramyl-L-alanine amidase AmpD [Parendozoicomonas haliclonae]SMA49995.1 1,6-anhydro-N-acetylmuramyl-L-alanine amidase AmpD [Parendozoicomonas haliclonae]